MKSKDEIRGTVHERYGKGAEQTSSSSETGLDKVGSDLQREAFEAVTSIKVRARKPR